MRAFPSLFSSNSETRKKYYKPFSTRAPVLFVFFVILILCIVLLQNIAEHGTPISEATTSNPNSTTPHKRDTPDYPVCTSSTICNQTQMVSSAEFVSTYDVLCGELVSNVTYYTSADTFGGCAADCNADSQCTAFTYTSYGYDDATSSYCCPGGYAHCVASSQCALSSFSGVSESEFFFDFSDGSAVYYTSGYISNRTGAGSTNETNTTSSTPVSWTNWSSSCVVPQGPSDCNAIRYVAESSPVIKHDYKVLCETYLDSTLAVFSEQQIGYDDCALLCLADMSCVAFGYWIPSNLECLNSSSYWGQEQCVWTYDTPIFVPPSAQLGLFYAGLVLLNTTNTTSVPRSTTSPAASTSISTLTSYPDCTSAGPSACNVTVSPGPSLPAYDVSCGYTLANTYDNITYPTTFDGCAADCLDDMKCTAFFFNSACEDIATGEWYCSNEPLCTRSACYMTYDCSPELVAVYSDSEDFDLEGSYYVGKIHLDSSTRICDNSSASSSSCTVEVPPDCGTVRSSGEGLPDYQFLCGAILESALSAYFLTYYTIDECALACFADQNCTAFSYSIVGWNPECEVEAVCGWTYDTAPEIWGPSSAESDNEYYFVGLPVSGIQSDAVNASATTLSSAASSSTSTCALATPPSDCGSLRSPGGSLPDYLVLCETYLESTPVVDFATPYSYDYCASECIADTNCTGFGYYSDGYAEGNEMENSDCSNQNYCWWTYDAVPAMWGASLVTGNNPSAYTAGVVIPSNSSSSASASNTTSNSTPSNSTTSTLAPTDVNALNYTVDVGVIAAINTSLSAVSDYNTSSTTTSSSAATSYYSSSSPVQNFATTSTISASVALSTTSSSPVVSIAAITPNSTVSPTVLINPTLSATLLATNITTSSTACTALVAPTACNALTILEDSVQIKVLCDTAVENIAVYTTATSWDDCAVQCLDDPSCTAFTLGAYSASTSSSDLSTPCCVGNSSCDAGSYSCFWTTDASPVFDEMVSLARRTINNEMTGQLISSSNTTASASGTSSNGGPTSSTSTSSSSSSSLITTTSPSSLLSTTSSSSSSIASANSTISSTTTSSLLGAVGAASPLSSSTLTSSSTLSTTTSSSSSFIFSSTTSSTTSPSHSSTLSTTTPNFATSTSSTLLSTLSTTTLFSSLSAVSSALSSSTLSLSTHSTTSSASSSSSTSSSSTTSLSSFTTTSLGPTLNAAPASSSSTTTQLPTSSSDTPTTSGLSTSSTTAPLSVSTSSPSSASVAANPGSLASTPSLSSSASSSASVSSSSSVQPVAPSSSGSAKASTSSLASQSSGLSVAAANPAPSTSNPAAISNPAIAGTSASASLSAGTSNLASANVPATASNPASTSSPASAGNINSASPNLNNNNSVQATSTNSASTNSAAVAVPALASGTNTSSGNSKTPQNSNGNGSGNGDGSGSGGGSSPTGSSSSDANGTEPVAPSVYSGFLSQYVYTIPGDVTLFSIVNATFAVITMSVLFKSFWCWVLAAARMMEPFYHLFRSSGASAEDSLLLPYIGAGTAWESLDPRNKRWVMLLTTIIAFMLSAMAELGSEAMNVRAGAMCKTNGRRTLCDPQWVINMAVLRAIQATLGLAAVSITVLVYLDWPNRSGMAVYPASIASMAEMLRHSDEELINDLRAIEPRATDKEVARALAGKHYSLTQVNSSSGELKYGIRCRPNPPAKRTTTLESADKTSSACHKRKSWYERIPYSHILHTLLHMSLFIVILLFLLYGNGSYIILLSKATSVGEALVSLPFKFLDGTQFGPRFMLSLICVLLSRYWEEIEVDVRILSPYRALSKRNMSKTQLDLMKLHGVPVTMVWHAMHAGNWFHALVSSVTVASYALVILVVGVPYTYGEVKKVSLISSAASVGILGSMLLTLVAVWAWKLTGPRMTRKPDTLVNVWLLLCASQLLEQREDFVGHDDGNGNDNEIRRFWYGKGIGTDGVERWMVDDGTKVGR